MSESVCTAIRECVNTIDRDLWFQCVRHVKETEGRYMHRDTQIESPFILHVNNDNDDTSEDEN